MNMQHVSFGELFDQFAAQEQLNDTQKAQFKTYLLLLLEWMEKINLTAITSVEDIIHFHFQDSLAIGQFMDFAAVKSIGDIGTGAGFPGIPLKIKYPHLAVTLIEVNHKKIAFLHLVIDELGLTDVQTNDLDWRTFLRKTTYDIDLFVSRGALAPYELTRLYRSNCHYKNARLVYWASTKWAPTEKEADLIEKELSYKIDNKIRKFIFFQKNDIY